MGSVLKHDRVTLDAAPTRASNGTAQGGACSTRRAELIRVDGVPVAVEVTCACGERTLVEFVDPTTSTADGPATNEHSD